MPFLKKITFLQLFLNPLVSPTMTIKTLFIIGLSAIALTSSAQADEEKKAVNKSPKGQMSEERKAAMLERFDVDKDGVLSEEERKAAMAARLERGNKKGGGKKPAGNRGARGAQGVE